ncbi:MAG: CPBP family intramembrane metalloprotease [Acidobacteriota bacterium]|nr:CPBP family intramembrane metalloprotease [Acidobacteriota bacterium]
MEPNAPFLNKVGRLRSGWRLGIYLVAFVASLFVFGALVRLAYVVAEHLHLTIGQGLADVVFRLVMLSSALLAGWVCNRLLEGLPWHALGLTFHSGWFRDLLIGSLVGGGALAIAALVAFAAGGLRFSFSSKQILPSVLQSLATTAALFIVAALAEEAAFRGYPLQTLTRAGLAWLGVLITSVPFALGHLQNPNVAAGFTFINTALAGVWLAMAYLKTRSLWFPLGVHWAWNWALGSVFGLPVSGLKLSAFPVLQAFDRGPAWLTGGSYGIEGGLAGTVALLISTVFIWRTNLVTARPELKKLTSEENPVRPNRSV